MIQPAPHQQRSSRPAARPAWMTFCLGLLSPALTQRDLAAQQVPREGAAPASEMRSNPTNRMRSQGVHKAWTRGDGFTLSGPRRV
jgi:hypothetical protein